MRILHSYRFIAVVLATTLAISACGQTSVEPPADLLSGQGVFANLADRHHAAARTGAVYDSPAMAMPHVRYAIDGAPSVSASEAYIVGDVVAVEAGRSFRWSTRPVTETSGKNKKWAKRWKGGPEEEVRTEVPFNARDAQISTVHVTVNIERSIVASDQPAQRKAALQADATATFALALTAPVNVEIVQAELESVGTLALLAYKGSPVFDYDESLWAVLEDGAFLGHINGNDTVTFPALGHEGEPAASFAIATFETEPSKGPIRVTTELAD